MENKEYLETTFPDGTPVKIYPVKEDKIVAYDHREGYPRPITWKEYKTMFAKLEYNA